MTARGLLHVFSHRRPASRSLEAAAAMRRYGYTVPDDLLTGTELRELEPTLSRRAIAGYLIEQERHVDPARLTAVLAVLARKSGTEIWEQAEVTRLAHPARAVAGGETGRGVLGVCKSVVGG